MKQTLSFHSPIIASTQSKVDVEAFEKSTDAFEKGEHLQSFYLLLDYFCRELPLEKIRRTDIQLTQKKAFRLQEGLVLTGRLVNSRSRVAVLLLFFSGVC